MTLELPSGLVDPGDTPEATALKELQEETGYVADRAEHVGTLLPDTGRYENRLWCYVARDARPSPTASSPEEGLEPILVDMPELVSLMRSSEFNHALNVAALMLALAGGHLPGLFAS